MQRFVLQQNIIHYQARLADETDEGTRLTLARLLIEAERSLAMLVSTHAGVDTTSPPLHSQRISIAAERYLAHFREHLSGCGKLYLLLDPGPGLRILDASDAYAAATMTERDGLRGRPLFEVFPDNPADAESNGVANLYASLRTAAQTCRPHEMPVQRYDIRDGESRFVERYWRPVNTPMLDDDGMVVALLHHVEDVTEAVLSPSAAGSPAIRASS
ncbi:MAG: PAS domain-containing protein [Reyranella sp.]